MEVKIEPSTGPATSFAYREYNDSVKPTTFGGPLVGELSVGSNQITVTATDIGGNTGSATVKVTSVVPTSGARKLGVYSLTHYEDGWKNDIVVGTDMDPYDNFWKVMVEGMGAYSVDKAKSHRFKDADVTAATVIPKVGAFSWEDFD
ncbi:MAG: hypothetical protein LAO23_21305 [Acidobacteriia bacterium]|nr:hypothetical protein [Terriglobia bacterium]